MGSAGPPSAKGSSAGPRTGWKRLALLALPAAVALAALGLYFSTAARTITWSHGGSDGAELSAAAATLGVAHPTGYPLYLLLAWCFAQLPVGEVAFRVALLSAVSAAAAAGVAAHIVAAVCAAGTSSGVEALAGTARLRSARGSQDHLASRSEAMDHVPAKASSPFAGTEHAPHSISLALGAVAAGAGLALSPLYWSQATIPEVYALHALLVLLVLAGMARWRPGDDRLLAAGALLAGAGLGNHRTLALLLLPAAVYVAVEDPGILRRRSLLAASAAFALGLAVYLYIPLRAAASPPLNWGNPADPQSFLSHVTASAYYGYVGNRPLGDAIARVPVMARLMGEQLTWPGLALSIFGLGELLRLRRRLAITLLAYLGLTLLFTLFYNAENGELYLIPATIVLALGLGVGVVSAAGARPTLWLAVALILVIIPWQLRTNLPAMDTSGDREAALYARSTLNAAPPNGVITTDRDEHTFALWYVQTVEGLRPDVAVVDRRLVSQQWYREQLQRSHPGALERMAS